jgi:hypothetical protein
MDTDGISSKATGSTVFPQDTLHFQTLFEQATALLHLEQP